MDNSQDLELTSIRDLQLSRRTFNALYRSDVYTVGELRELLRRNKLEEVRFIGQKSIEEISIVLKEFYKNIPNSVCDEEPLENSSKSKQEKPLNDIDLVPIDILDLHISIRGMLIKNGIKTIGELRDAADGMLLNINRIGPKTLVEIRQALGSLITEPKKYIAKYTIEDERPLFEDKKVNLSWAEIVQSYFESEKGNYTYILLARFGPNCITGLKPRQSRTLEGIASELGITRERVRQIEVAVAIRFLNYMRLATGATELLGKVKGILSFYGKGLSLKKFRETVKRENILGEFSSSFVPDQISKIDPFETLICWLNLLSNSKYSEPVVFPIDINALIRSENVSINDLGILKNISSKIRKKIKRKVYFTGGINIKDAMAILSSNERIATLVLDSLNLRKLENSWYSLKTYDVEVDGGKMPLRLAGLKMLGIASEVDFTVFCDGLSRHINRFYAMLAPADVLMQILPLLGFEINDRHKVSTRLSVDNVLSKSEKSLISAITKYEDVASFLEITEEFFLHKLSLPAVSVTLRRSPIVEKVDEGLYKLRGTDTSWQQIEFTKKRQKRFSQDDEIVHGLDGIIRMKFTVNSYTYLSGVVQAYNVRELPGLWSVVHDGRSFGDAKIDESYLWGLSKIFRELDVQMGDRVELAFNTWNRTLSVEKVNHGNS